jgi:hypothetical protein
LPQEETKEILQTMMRLEFEAFIGGDIEKYVRTMDMRGRNGMEWTRDARGGIVTSVWEAIEVVRDGAVTIVEFVQTLWFIIEEGLRGLGLITSLCSLAI